MKKEEKKKKSMRLLEIFDRKNRKWITQISVKNGTFQITGDNIEFNQKLIKHIQKITVSKLRHIGVFLEKGEIVEVFRNQTIKAEEKNLQLLEKELGGWLPNSRFIIIDTDKLAKESEEVKQLIKNSTYLNAEQKIKILKMLERSNKKEVPLLIDDILALERFSQLI